MIGRLGIVGDQIVHIQMRLPSCVHLLLLEGVNVDATALKSTYSMGGASSYDSVMWCVLTSRVCSDGEGEKCCNEKAQGA